MSRPQPARGSSAEMLRTLIMPDSWPLELREKGIRVPLEAAEDFALLEAGSGCPDSEVLDSEAFAVRRGSQCCLDSLGS